jgi:glyoxylate carboligase
MDLVSGGQLAAEALVQKEVDTIFTLSGGHITPIYQYLENAPITLFDTRHEQAAVFMAEAWGRMTRKYRKTGFTGYAAAAGYRANGQKGADLSQSGTNSGIY